MQIAILLYENMTALDAIGPYEVLSRLPGANLCFTAERAGPVRTDTGFLQLVAQRPREQVESADLLLGPGGPGDVAVRESKATLDWVRRIHAGSTWTTSVCTGSLILAAAGLLDGKPATTHWASLDTLAELGAKPRRERAVWLDKIVTAAGVSAGIDMALRLAAKIAGDDFARALQLGIEYDPDPPFDAGSPDKVDPAIRELVRTALMRA
ncbi:MAG: DJ-1/PfpI family protein [Myxococcota bacterium]